VLRFEVRDDANNTHRRDARRDDRGGRFGQAARPPHIARFKRPREYRYVDALPKNNYGKVLKTELRRLLAEP
jgi:acyl-CoA synthetase (AMP-forming)/AMP-acid ligase II